VPVLAMTFGWGEYMMKVAVFVSYLPPHIGGIEVIAEGQIKGLAESGQTITVITSACGSKAGLSKYDGYELRRIPAWNYFEEKMGAVFPIYLPSLFWYSYKAVKSSDIVHAHDAFYLTSFTAAFWARVLRRPLILTQHVDLVPHSSKVVALVQKVAYATTGRFILRSARKIIVLNSRVRDFLIDKGVDKSKIVFLPNGIDTEVFSPATNDERSAIRRKYSLPEDKVLALFMGRFVPKKGFTTLFSLKTIPNLELVFAGGHAPINHTRSDQHFLGPITRDQVPDVFKMCDIFVLPSLGEGFPVTVQEAMASGLPIITTDDPAYDLYGLDRSRVKLIEPSIRMLSAALRSIVEDPKLRLQMGRYSREYALSNFHIKTHVNDLKSLFRIQLK
jgi:D-inositol-3-phosphate glycosyltransferase